MELSFWAYQMWQSSVSSEETEEVDETSSEGDMVLLKEIL